MTLNKSNLMNNTITAQTILVAGKFGDTNTIITQEAIDRFAQKYANEKIPMRHGVDNSVQRVFGAMHSFRAKPGKLVADCAFVRPEVGKLLEEFPDKFTVACTLIANEQTDEPEEIISADIVPVNKLRRPGGDRV